MVASTKEWKLTKLKFNPSKRNQIIKFKIPRVCQGCGSQNIRKIDIRETYHNGKPSGYTIERYTCRDCGHLSIYGLKEENWRVD